MKLTCIVQIYNELEKGNLPRFMDSIQRYCDALIIYNDGCTDGSVEYISNGDWLHKQLKEIHFIHGSTNNFSNEIAHKQMLLDKAIEINSDWVFWLDADECVEYRKEQGIRLLCENAKDITAFGFREINLWRNENFYRLDNAYNDGEFCRLWKNTGELYYDSKPGLHQRQYPNGITDIVSSDIKVVHYGFSSDERILNKYITYKAHGQTGWELERLIDERTLRVARSKPEWFKQQPAHAKFAEIFNIPVVSRLT